MWPFDRLKKAEQKETETEKPATRGLWSTDLAHTQKRDFVPTIPDFKIPEVASAGMAMDAVIGQPHKPWQGQMIGVSPALMEWYASQSFIGYPACAMMATHWLIDKACRMPARDAIRQGYTLDVGGEEISEQLRKSDKRYNLDEHMREMIAMGRVYGIRAVLFDVLSTDPEYYEKPFNIDGVMPGCYRGMVQIDPQWITADLCQGDVNDPASPDFMRPSFWRVGNRRYHRSHFHFFIPFPVSTFLRPTYNYGGASVPQRIYERVYGAERTANEAPQLVMTKRLLTFMAAEGSDMARVRAGMAEMSEMMNNYGILAHGPGESFASTDTALGDVDTTTMTQYQLVAAGANVPATKLLGTQPKGFNATGEYEESVYREELESIQSCDLSPLLERHYSIVAKSRRIEIDGELQVQWAPLDSPTAQEWATINKTKAETDAIYYGMQAIDGVDVRERLRSDREGDYYGLAEEEELIDENLMESEPTGISDPSVPASTSPSIAPDESIAQVSMNGAQISSLVGVLSGVADGTMPPDTAREIISSAFPLDPETISRMIAPMLKLDMPNEADSNNPQATPVGGTAPSSVEGITAQLPGASPGALPVSP